MMDFYKLLEAMSPYRRFKIDGEDVFIQMNLETQEEIYEQLTAIAMGWAEWR